MRIAVLQDDFPPYNQGGAGAIAYRLARGLAQRGHKVLVLTTVREQKDAGTFEETGMRVVRIHSSYPERFREYVGVCNPFALRAVARHLREFAPDVVHAHSVHRYLSYGSLVLARRYARKVYITEHDAMSFYFGKLPSEKDPTLTGDSPCVSGFRSFLKQVKANRLRFNPLRIVVVRYILGATLDRSIVVSGALEKALNRNGIRNTTVIHNGIDADAWQRPQIADAFRSRHKVGNHAILFGGRLSGAKGAMAMLESMAHVRQQVPDAQLLIMGRGDAYAERMQERAKQLGVEDALVWLGWIDGDDLRAAYHAAAVVAVPSLYLDPFPTVNLEAFACHRAVVSTCFGGSRELVQDGVNGYVINPLNIEKLSGRLAELLLDDNTRRAFGNAGYERVRSEFSLAVQVDRYEEMYLSLSERDR